MVKSLRCLRYQCSEGPVIETALYERMNEICDAYEATGVYDTAAYERAPWGLEDADPAPAPSCLLTTELTPEGEQFVIPGCERKRSKALRQLDLFG